jgi:tetratricopeptide (TPR) repeat protein
MTATRRRARPARLLLVALSLALPAAADAQRPRQAARPVAASRREVRAELAATLLNANRFDEAAAEYRRLLATDPGNRAYRLGLARALAWGDHPREAERELVRARDRQNASVVEPLLRSVRSAFDPTAAEATAWRRESPGYLPYRLALARALAREAPWRAIAQYDTLRLAALAGADGIPDEPALIREQADAYVAMGARPSAITVLGAGVDRAPRDTALRRSLAVALFDAGRADAARAQFDTLIAMGPTAAAYVGRANASLALGDTASGADDLARSIGVRPNYDAYYMLATLAREHEDFGNARLLYDRARRTAPDAPSRGAITAAGGGLAREERPVVAFVPALGTDPGWSVTTQSATDNAGVSYLSMDARRVAALGAGFTADVDFGVRRIAQSGTLGAPAATGSAVSVGAARQVIVGRAMFAGAAHGGIVTHPGLATFGRGSVSAGAWFDAWMLGVDVSREPAYEALFTPAVLALRGGPTPALIANAATISTGGPVGPMDVAGSWTRTWLSDGNFGQSLDAYARLPLTSVSSHLNAVYQGNVVSYAEATSLYWDPVRYASHAVGPELAMRHAHGLSLAARVLAGLATSVERDTTARNALIRQSALQLSTGGEASYRGAWWEGAAGIAYGRGRAGGYERLGATVTIRVLR